MRPPQNAGEDMRQGKDVWPRMPCFNEAPAERGGRPNNELGWYYDYTGFNEAPAERGGRRGNSC